MSKIFQALERAERERALRGQPSGGPQTTPSPADAQQLSFVSPANQSLKQHPSPDLAFERETVQKSLEGVDSHLVSFLAPETLEAERYRSICYNIEKVRREKGASVLAIVSPELGDGKTTTAINLAGTFAQHPDIRVLLIDLDFRRPAIRKRLGFVQNNTPGLVEMIGRPSLSLKEVVVRPAELKFSLLLAGDSPILPHDVLNSSRVGEILQEARQEYDYVLLDLPPLLPASDGQRIERWADGFVLVVSADKTSRKLIEEALRIVDQTKLIGLIFNNYKSPAFGYYSYYTYNDTSPAQTGWIARMRKKLTSSLYHPSRQ